MNRLFILILIFGTTNLLGQASSLEQADIDFPNQEYQSSKSIYKENLNQLTPRQLANLGFFYFKGIAAS